MPKIQMAEGMEVLMKKAKISQTEMANLWGVNKSAINYHLRKGTPKARRYLDLIVKKNELEAVETTIQVLQRYGHDKVAGAVSELVGTLTTQISEEHKTMAVEEARNAIEADIETEINAIEAEMNAVIQRTKR